ncbi:MAG: hypothetical protein M1142_02665 [Patescibacteria group bacterium]|nr:hypothetical protein [Patescibacteria group bacterium]
MPKRKDQRTIIYFKTRRTKRLEPDQQKHEKAVPEDIKTGEQTTSGSTPDPESDDDTLDDAHEAGLYENQDEDHPGELGIDEEIHKDELEHQDKD